MGRSQDKPSSATERLSSAKCFPLALHWIIASLTRRRRQIVTEMIHELSDPNLLSLET